MEQLRQNVKLNSLSMSEKFIKNAMKNAEIHDKSVSLVNAAIIDMCGSAGPPVAREVNTDSFITTLNDSLVQLAPELAYGIGLAKDPNNPTIEETAEDIAA